MSGTSHRVWRLNDGRVELFGGRDRSTGVITFPMPEGGEAERYDEVRLQNTGKLWSYTVQRFPPKSPPFHGVTDRDQFQPFAVGYVELAGQVIVESRIVVDDFDRLKIGIPMELTTDRFTSGADGSIIETFAFKPA
ncbi:MAG: OB-fold domain-containing protein [Pseudomonadota bacterium]